MVNMYLSLTEKILTIDRLYIKDNWKCMELLNIWTSVWNDQSRRLKWWKKIVWLIFTILKPRPPQNKFSFMPFKSSSSVFFMGFFKPLKVSLPIYVVYGGFQTS